MEGPSLFLAAEQLTPLVGQQIKKVGGNTKVIDKDRLFGEKILSIFAYGKYLFFQFKSFALRVHFLLFGSFEATIKSIKVTGDYPRKVREPRLSLFLKGGDIQMYSCSVRLIEHSDVRTLCDFSTDPMTESWDGNKAFKTLQKEKENEIADVLLDQTIFTGVGNIIKNEVLFLAKIQPERKVKDLSQAKLKKIVSLIPTYMFQFYEWRKNFELKKHYQIYRQSVCKNCGGKVQRKRTGVRKRISFICPHCEK
jgi:endonuclease-8